MPLTSVLFNCIASNQHLLSASYLYFLVLALYTVNLRVTLEVGSIIYTL